MRDRPRQLAFDLPLAPRYGRDDFLVGPSNERACALVERWPDWPGPTLALTGPRGSGKSHLAAIWAARAGAATLDATSVTGTRVPDLVAAGALVVEDLDRGARDEPALFHLLNLAREHGCHLLLTGAAGVEGWGLGTPDLVSRLRLAPRATLSAPDDALLRAVLVKLFLDRQLVVDTTVVDYLALRIERSLERAGAVVAALDREALSRGRRITRPMAAELLGVADGDEDEPD